MDKLKVMQTLGLGAKANSLVWGVKLFEQIKAQKVYLVILAPQMGASQKKKLLNQCQYYGIEVWTDVLNQTEIAHSCGKPQIVAVGITNLNLFKLIKKYN